MVKTVKGYIALSAEDKIKSVREQFKGQVIDPQIKFPKDIGAPHPFSFEDMEKSFTKIGLINGLVNMLKNSIVGDFQIKADDANIQAFLNSFIEDTQFSSVLREWIKEGLLKGNGFLELDLDNNKIRPLNANDMYVKRTKKGKVIEYNQWLGNDFKNFTRTSTKLVPFKPNQIAHLKLNKVSNAAYALGAIYPSERDISNIVQMQQDLNKLMKRKAGMPIHVKIGEPGESVQDEDIEAMSAKLQFMNNKTEWVTDGNIDMKLIDFAGIGDNLTKALENALQNLATNMNIPVVMLGVANIPEGLAKVQGEQHQRYIESIREEIENVIEEKIFKPLLLNQKLTSPEAEGVDKKAVGSSEKVEFIWNLPGEEEINKRIEKITSLLANFNISENMKRFLQLELARLLDLDEADRFLMEPEVGLDEQEKEEKDEQKKAAFDIATNKLPASNSPEAKKEKKIKQPEVPGAKPGAKAKLDTTHKHLTESQSAAMTIKEFVSLQEIEGFNYSEYLVRILKRLRIDKFEQLAALDKQGLAEGLLGERDINKLRIILKDGFRQNQTIGEIEKQVRDNIPLKDRLKDGRITMTSSLRPTAIARTETVRIANQGLLDTYQDNGIKEVRFLAALSDRTCPQCEALNGQVFMLKESQGIIPVHAMCRCTWLSVL